MISMEFVIDPEVLEKEYGEKKKDIDQAVRKTAYTIRDRARYHLNESEYKMSKVAREGIVLGKLKKDGPTAQTKVHAFGYGESKEGALARIFVAGTVYRNNGKGNRGYIRPNPAIDTALDQNILDNNIQDILR